MGVFQGIRRRKAINRITIALPDGKKKLPGKNNIHKPTSVVILVFEFGIRVYCSRLTKDYGVIRVQISTWLYYASGFRLCVVETPCQTTSLRPNPKLRSNIPYRPIFHGHFQQLHNKPYIPILLPNIKTCQDVLEIRKYSTVSFRKKWLAQIFIFKFIIYDETSR